MPSKASSRSRRDDLDVIRGWVEAPAYLVVEPRVLVHERRKKPGAPCPCCGSAWARISEERRLPRLIIRTSDGERFAEEDCDPEAFGDLAELSHAVDLPLRVPAVRDHERDVSPLDLLFDEDATTHAVSGGNRSGKSTFGTDAWLPYRWLRRGGRHRLFRALAPEMKQAHLLKDKMLVGEGNKPPAFPPELVISIPEHERSQVQRARLVDGSEIEFTHAKDAGHLKGVSVEATIWTEVTECRRAEVYTVSVARHDTGGQLYLDSTPVRGHWMEQMIITEDKPPAEGERRSVRAMCMRSVDNPWLDPKEIAARREAAFKVDPLTARREFDGEWVGNNSLIFGDTWDPRRHVVDMPGGYGRPDLGALGLVDITTQAARKFFGARNSHEWIVGVDVNHNPHTAVVCKAFVREGERLDDIAKWGLLVYDEIRTWNSDSHGAAKALHDEKNGLYRGAALAIDAKSAESTHRAHVGDNSATTPRKDYVRFGFNCRPNRHPKTGEPWNPFVKDSVGVMRQLLRQDLMIVNATNCPGVIRAVELCEDRGDGKPVKVSNTFSDREIAAFIDSLRYISWPVYSRGQYGTPVRVHL